jgi:hypothetical protein
MFTVVQALEGEGTIVSPLVLRSGERVLPDGVHADPAPHF